jgi:hypothetical protein
MAKLGASHSLPARIYNLGSKAAADLDFTREALWLRMNASMGRKAVQIPVFLVNEAQMDELSPSERKRALDPRYVKEWLNRRREARELFFMERPQKSSSLFLEDRRKPYELPPNINQLDFNSWEAFVQVVGLGLYVRHPQPKQAVVDKGDPNVQEPEAVQAYQTAEGPHIYLCCERIVRRGEQEGISPNLVLDKVYYHELGHALLDVPKSVWDTGDDPYPTPWGRTIEESAANYIAYRRFQGMEALLVQRLIASQPAEYLGYVAFTQAPLTAPPTAKPGSWDRDDEQHYRWHAYHFYQAWPAEWNLSLREWRERLHEWHRSGRRRPKDFVRWIDEVYGIDPDEFWWHVQHGRIPPPPFMFWGWSGISQGGKIDFGPANMRLWRRYKAEGAPRAPGYVRPLEAFALYLLQEGVNA